MLFCCCCLFIFEPEEFYQVNYLSDGEQLESPIPPSLFTWVFFSVPITSWISGLLFWCLEGGRGRAGDLGSSYKWNFYDFFLHIAHGLKPCRGVTQPGWGHIQSETVGRRDTLNFRWSQQLQRQPTFWGYIFAIKTISFRPSIQPSSFAFLWDWVLKIPAPPPIDREAKWVILCIPQLSWATSPTGSAVFSLHSVKPLFVVRVFVPVFIPLKEFCSPLS